jgi:hypothetical protein
MSRRIYYAHCIAIYSTPQEDRDVAMLEEMGFEVINPNNPQMQERCDELKQRFKDGHLDGFFDAHRGQQPRLTQFRDAGEAIMELIFKPLISPAKIDALAFRALPDGRIPAGVYLEVQCAREKLLPVIELPANLSGRQLSVESTREYLREIGVR